MRYRATAALLLTTLTWTALAQTQYHPLEVGSKPGKANAKQIKLALWSAKPGLSAQLGPEKPLFGWAIRPPKQFVSTLKTDNGNQIFVFQGNPRPDNSAPIMWVITGDRRQARSDQPQEEVLLDFYMIQLHQTRENWKTTSAEYGSIQGRKFIRRRWSGTETVEGNVHHVRGVVYLTLDGAKNYTAVTIQDSEPGANSTINLMEASLFTFHKR